MEAVTWRELPLDVYTHICPFLGETEEAVLSEACKLRLISKHWRQVVESYSFPWKALYERRYATIAQIRGSETWWDRFSYCQLYFSTRSLKRKIGKAIDEETSKRTKLAVENLFPSGNLAASRIPDFGETARQATDFALYESLKSTIEEAAERGLDLPLLECLNLAGDAFGADSRPLQALVNPFNDASTEIEGIPNATPYPNLFERALKGKHLGTFKALKKFIDEKTRDTFVWAPLWGEGYILFPEGITFLESVKNLFACDIFPGIDELANMVNTLNSENLTEVITHPKVVLKETNRQGLNLLSVASSNCSWEALELLLKQGLSPDSLNSGQSPSLPWLKGSTPLHTAATHGSSRGIDLLIQYGATVDYRSQNNGTALHVAASYGNAEGVGKLIEKGAQKDLQTDNGDTPLHLATQTQYGDPVEVVQVLLDSGWNGLALNGQGESPLDLAKDRTDDKRDKLVQQLELPR